MPLHYISLNLFEKCLYFQSTFILYYGSSKIENFDLATKTEIMIIGLTTSCEIIQIEITNSRKYMRIPIIFSMISFKFVYYVSFNIVILFLSLLEKYKRDQKH